MRCWPHPSSSVRPPEAAARHHDAPSIWAFIVADTASFGIFFAVFMSERLGQPALYAQSARLLDRRLGLINTLILITSSWLVALAVAASRDGKMHQVRRLLPAGIAVGGCFGVIKVIEYTTKIEHGITPLTNDFFSYYFILTGVHFMHYLIGLAVLAVLTVRAFRPQPRDGGEDNWLESGALYWHMVDLLWIFLFPMLYLQAGA